MTLDDLMTLFQSARQGTRDWNGTEWVGVYGGDRAGVTAIVRAVRDEIFDARGNASYGSLAIYDLFNEILGSDAGEKVAGGTTREDEQSCNSSDGSSPATDAAPAVCEWKVVALADKYTAHFQICDGFAIGFGLSTAICPECGKPIKFTEGKT